MATTDGDRIPKYERSPARAGYVVFEGRPASEDSDEVAAAIDGWLAGVLDAAPAQGGGRRSE